ncbi:hypothetical protein, partial [uncultured Anaerotruncus sp.]|uniref:hypothetical protein n=1 Tax=uncultured Anaerotruncus sp. TaxID=905011 RepID=UPI0026734859
RVLRRTFGSFSSVRKGTRGARRNAQVILAAWKAAIPVKRRRPQGKKSKTAGGRQTLDNIVRLR